MSGALPPIKGSGVSGLVLTGPEAIQVVLTGPSHDNDACTPTNEPIRYRRIAVRQRTGSAEDRRALRHAAAQVTVVAPHSDSSYCSVGVFRNSHLGADAAVRSAGLAERGKRLCLRQKSYLGVLAPRDYSGGLVAAHCGVVVMNTTAFDGQWTRKVIEWMGYGTAQGSSSRGGLRGLAVMARRIEEGRDCAFTIDGPRGPRYVAQTRPSDAGAAQRSSGRAFFHIGVERGKTFEKLGIIFCCRGRSQKQL